MLRRAEHRGRGAFLDDFTLVHHGDAVAHLCGNAQIMRDEQHREIEALAHVVDQFEHLCLHRDVKRRNWFVGDQDFRLHRECARDADALALTAGELVREALKRVRIETDKPHQLLRAFERFFLGHSEVDRPLGDRRADGAARIERTIGVLEHDLHALAMRAQRAG